MNAPARVHLPVLPACATPGCTYRPSDVPSAHDAGYCLRCRARRARVREARRVVARSTVDVRRLSPRDLALGRAHHPADDGDDRPRTWGECLARGLGVTTPCAYVGCRHHAAIEVREHVAITINAPHVPADGTLDLVPEIDVAAMPVTCTLAAAHDGERDGEAIGAVLGIVRERVRQHLARGLGRIAALHPELADAVAFLAALAPEDR